MAATALIYAIYDGDPCVCTDGRAWLYVNGAWLEISRAEAGNDAVVLGKAAFEKHFGQLPVLPPLT
jgi:hypothetical protein